jgi:TonB family protein
MTLLLGVTVRSSIVLLTCLALRACLYRRSARLRHLVVTAGLAAAAVVGPMGAALPSIDVTIPTASPVAAHPPATARSDGRPAVAGTTAIPTRVPAITSSAVFAVWSTGFFATLTVLASGVLRVRRIAAASAAVTDGGWQRTLAAVARAYGLRRQIVLLKTATPDLLATCGAFRPRVLLPSHISEWSDERIHVVLCHELAHVRRLDWPVQTGAEIVRAVLWFNPFVWIACSLLRRDGEQACDDLVLQRGVAPHDYAAHLLDIVRACRPSVRTPLQILRMARPSTLERRIADMLNPRIQRQFSAPTAGIACALLLAVTIPTAVLRAAQTGPATLSGTVYDPTGAVMPGVALALEDATQMKVETKTNAAGRFAFSNVQPGHYTLDVSLPGFRTLKQEFDLATRADWDRAVTLQIGDLRESVIVSARRGPATAPPQASAQPVRVGGSVRAPLKTLDVKPTYPASMRDAGREGVVPIEAIIGVDGTVTTVRVLSAQVHPDFAIAAVDAVRQWKFTPTLLNGSPVEVVMNVSVAFTLSTQ